MARKSRKPKQPKTLWDKVHEFDANFAAEINGMTEAILKARLVTFADEDNRTEDARELDTDLKTIKENLKTANETYSVPLKQNKLRRRLILDTLKGLGKL